MRWNVVVTTRADAYQAARKALSALGRVASTDFFDVLVMEVEHPERFLDDLRELATRTPRLPEWIGHAVPCTRLFDFQSPEAFEAKMAPVIQDVLPELAGRRFYVRVHRRGFEGRLHSGDEERAIGEAVLTSLAELGTPACVSFDDPEVVLDVEIVGTRAGVALLAADDLDVFPVTGAQ